MPAYKSSLLHYTIKPSPEKKKKTNVSYDPVKVILY